MVQIVVIILYDQTCTIYIYSSYNYHCHKTMPSSSLYTPPHTLMMSSNFPKPNLVHGIVISDFFNNVIVIIY